LPDAGPAGTDAGEYRLRSGDRIDVDFLVDDTLDFSTPVTPSGTVSVPLAGEIVAAGKTTGELATAVEEAIGGYLLDPTVTIVIAGIAKQPIFVIGEVDKPGRIEATGDLTVSGALAVAGGLLPSGKPSSVMVIRTTGVEEPTAIRVDVTKILTGRDFSEDIVLVPNDVVYVPKSVIGKINEFVDLFFDNIAPAQLFYLRGYDMAHRGDDGRVWY
jgi:polysaccharide export outer membrane protein